MHRRKGNNGVSAQRIIEAGRMASLSERMLWGREKKRLEK